MTHGHPSGWSPECPDCNPTLPLEEPTMDSAQPEVTHVTLNANAIAEDYRPGEDITLPTPEVGVIIRVQVDNGMVGVEMRGWMHPEELVMALRTITAHVEQVYLDGR